MNIPPPGMVRNSGPRLNQFPIQRICDISAPLGPAKMLRYSIHMCSSLADPAVVFRLPLSPRPWRVRGGYLVSLRCHYRCQSFRFFVMFWDISKVLQIKIPPRLTYWKNIERI